MFLAGTTAMLPLAAGFSEIIADTTQLGQATLIAIAAMVVGFVVRRVWLKSLNPVLFGTLAGVGVVAGLAALGVPQAGVVLWLAIAAAIVLLGLAFFFN